MDMDGIWNHMEGIGETFEYFFKVRGRSDDRIRMADVLHHQSGMTIGKLGQGAAV